MPSSARCQPHGTREGESSQLSVIVCCCPSALLPTMPLPPLLARSLLERTVGRVMKAENLPFVESQCAEHGYGSLCPSTLLP